MLRGRRDGSELGPWSRASGRTRVLVENPDCAVRWAYAGVLARAGYDVETCGGPGEGEGEAVRCPLLEGRHCLLVDGADVVVSSCDLAESREILARLAVSAPAVVFQAPAPAFDRYRDIAGGSLLLADPVTEAGLCAAVADVGLAPEAA